MIIVSSDQFRSSSDLLVQFSKAKFCENGVRRLFLDLICAAAGDGGSGVWSVRGGAADGLCGAGDDVQIWCVLLFGADMVVFGRRNQDVQGRGGAAEEEACGAVWVLRSGGVSVRRGLQAGTPVSL